MKARPETFFRLVEGGLEEEQLLSLVTDEMMAKAADRLVWHVSMHRAAWEEGHHEIASYRPPRACHRHAVMVRRNLDTDLAEVPNSIARLSRYRRISPKADLPAYRCVSESPVPEEDQTEEFRRMGECAGILIYYEI